MPGTFPHPIPAPLSSFDGLPAARTLLDAEAVREIAAAALAPLDVAALRARQIVCRISRSLTVLFECDVIDGDGTMHQQPLVIRAGGKFPPGTLVVADGQSSLGVWRFPHDPYLPGLGSLFDPGGIRAMLRQLGWDQPDASGVTRSYRPGRRAVVEFISAEGRFFVKVVRPHTVASLQEIHRIASGQVPIPRSLGWSEQAGVVVLEALEGRPLDQELQAGSTDLPSAGEINSLLDRLPQFPGAASSPVDRVADHVELLGLLIPGADGLLADIATDLGSVTHRSLVPVHGDLHTGQIVVAEGKPVGLIDLDRAGIGYRLDDLAGLLAHLDASGYTGSYMQRLLEDLDRRFDRRELRLRVAAAMLGFASGPFTSQQPGWPQEVLRRIESARSWAASD